VTDRNDAIAIVTGGSYAPGREVSRELARRDFAVVVVYLRDEREVEAAIDAILASGGAAVAVRADVADELDVERLFDEAAAAFGGVDALVHTTLCDATELYRQAARRLRHGGAIVSLSSPSAVTPALADALRARDITVNGLAPGLEPPGAGHGVAHLVALLEHWRGQPGDVTRGCTGANRGGGTRPCADPERWRLP
jgi:3-oxoacyl-[acyl-carrier protein] reductase